MVAEDTGARYQRFADREARGSSAIYEAWASGVAQDTELIALLEHAATA
jgi:hypothetical protein